MAVLNQRIRGLLKVSKTSLIIGSGLASAGIGQLIFGLLPSTEYSPNTLSVLAIWQSISFGVGLIIGSPLNGVIYTELALAKGNLTDSRFSSHARALFRICFMTMSVVSFMLLAMNRWIFDGDFLLALLLITSLFLQLIAAVQRAVMSAKSLWWRFSSQFMLEGFGRIAVTLLSLAISHGSLHLLIGLNVGVQVISITLPVIRFQWTPNLRGKSVAFSEALHLFIPLCLAAVAIQSLLSLSPVFAKGLGGASPIQIATLGGLAQVIRIPVTFSSPITLPHLNSIAINIADGEFSRVPKQMRQVVSILLLLWGIYGLAVIVGGSFMPSSTFTYGSVLTLKLWIAISISSILAPSAIFFHSVALLLRQSRIMILAWGIALGIYAMTIHFYGRSASGVIFAIDLALISANGIFLILLHARFLDIKID